jgi:hypothetical protein
MVLTNFVRDDRSLHIPASELCSLQSPVGLTDERGPVDVRHTSCNSSQEKKEERVWQKTRNKDLWAATGTMELHIDQGVVGI